MDAYTGAMDIPADHCQDGCPGNHDERCGGDGALTLYRNGKIHLHNICMFGVPILLHEVNMHEWYKSAKTYTRFF